MNVVATNPYAPPTAETDLSVDPRLGAPASTARLFTQGAVLLATLLGSLLGGVAVLAVNFRRLGRRRAAVTALLLGSVGTVGLLALAMAIPEDVRVANLVLTLIQLGLMKQVTASTLGEDLARQRRERREPASTWGAVGLGLAGMAAVVVLLVVLVFAWAAVKS